MAPVSAQRVIYASLSAGFNAIVIGANRSIRPLFEHLETLKDRLDDLIAVPEKQAERAETIEQCRVRQSIIQ